MTWVKFCGIKTIDDANNVAMCRADAIGFVVGISPYEPCEDERRLERSKNIIENFKHDIERIAVTRVKDIVSLFSIIETLNVDSVQLFHNFSSEELDKIYSEFPKIKIIKTICVKDNSAIELAEKYELLVDRILLDSCGDLGRGGTGNVHNWSISKMVVSSVRTPVILAGGLNPSNISDAISIVKPWGVDMDSGVTTDGKKNVEKMKLIMGACKNK